VDFRIDPDKCVACLACVRVCPADAVAVEGPQVRIVDAACTRCGLCLPACPHDAIEALGDAARALELAAAGTAAATFLTKKIIERAMNEAGRREPARAR